MADPYFFGYGSLVNTTTHDFPDPRRAKICGWRRAWRHTDQRAAAFLTAIRAPGEVIEGMIAHVPDDDWAALDLRERAYDRVPVSDAVSHPISRQIDIAIYAVPEARHSRAVGHFPILLSYLDVVIQGYLREFGEAGAADFFVTTDGWDRPVQNDRAAPRYPRHRQLSRAETGFVDDRLAALSVEITVAD